MPPSPCIRAQPTWFSQHCAYHLKCWCLVGAWANHTLTANDVGNAVANDIGNAVFNCGGEEVWEPRQEEGHNAADVSGLVVLGCDCFNTWPMSMQGCAMYLQISLASSCQGQHHTIPQVPRSWGGYDTGNVNNNIFQVRSLGVFGILCYFYVYNVYRCDVYV